MSEPAPASVPESSWLKPTWFRLAAAALMAIASFFVPQAVPLEWYPLNEPGTDINYLEITCAADKAGEVRIYYDLGAGFSELNSIRIPISPTTQTFTYTFPLPDAPITGLRIDPLDHSGELTIRQMRIINRRSEEIRRFTRVDFTRLLEVDAIDPLPDGWKIVSHPNATAPKVRVELPSPIVPVGMDHRNLLRCLLSTGYLALMLFILLLAVLTATWRPRGWRDFFVHAGFMAALALLFAPVGNRGLLRNSIRYARFEPPPPRPDLALAIDLANDNPTTSAQLFWNRGTGVSEADSLRVQPEPHKFLQSLRFALPREQLAGLRFDPLNGKGMLSIRGLRLVDGDGNTRLVLPLDSLHPMREIARLEVQEEWLTIETAAKATDPMLEFTPAALARINAVLVAPAPR